MPDHSQNLAHGKLAWVASKRQSLHNAFSVRANLKLAPHFIQFADEFALSRNGCALRIVHFHAHFTSLPAEAATALGKPQRTTKTKSLHAAASSPLSNCAFRRCETPADCHESEK